jgi:hypothetical protein
MGASRRGKSPNAILPIRTISDNLTAIGYKKLSGLFIFACKVNYFPEDV